MGKIRTLEERPAHIAIGIFADPGAGKTKLIGSSPRCLILNADGETGPESITDEDRERFGPGGDSRIWDIDGGFADLDKAYRALRKDPARFDWVWLDSATLFQEADMDVIMEELVIAKPHRDPDVPDMQQYLKNQNRLGKWMRHMTKLPINFGYTAHVMRIEDEDGEVTYMPAIAGGRSTVPLTSKICGYMAIVGHLEVLERDKKGGKPEEKEAMRVLHTRRYGKWYGKDRYDVLGGRVIRPTIPKIQAAITGGE